MKRINAIIRYGLGSYRIFTLGLGLILSQGLSAQIFQNAKDSLWFMQNMPMPKIHANFEYSFTGAMLNYRQAYTPPAPPERLWPKDIEGMTRYLAANPDSYETAWDLFMAYSSSDAKQAEAYLQQALSTMVERSFEQGDIRLLRNALQRWSNVSESSLQTSLEISENFIESHSNIAEAWSLRAKLNLMAGDSASAEESLDKALALGFPTDETLLALAKHGILKGMARRQGVQDFINEPKLPLGSYPKLNDYSLIDKLQAQYPDSTVFKHLRAVMQTVELFNNALHMSTKRGDYRESRPFKLSQYLDKNSKKETEALKAYFQKQLKEKGNANPYLSHKSLMLLEILSGRPKQAEQQLQAAQKWPAYQGDESDLLRLSALAYISAQDYKNLEPRWRQTLSFDSSYSNRLFMAKILAKQGQGQAALDLVERMIQENYNDSKVLMLRTYLYWQAGNMDEAFAAIKFISDLGSEHPLQDEDFYFYFGLGLFWVNEPEACANVLNMIKERGQEYPVSAKAFLDYFKLNKE